MHRRGQLTLTVLLVGLAMLTAPLPALASHNDVGARVVVSNADEVDADGNLQPDIPDEDSDDPNSVYDEVRFHWNLKERGLPARPQPADQSGDRYTDCDEAGENPGENGYFDGLTATGNSCYVGYMDLQLEYVLSGWPQLGWNADPVYPANPGDPEDGHQDDQDQYCRGERETQETTGIEDVDVLVSRANRTVDGYNEGSSHQCGGFNHDFSSEYDLMIDADILEPAQHLEPAHGTEETTLATPGSGYYTLPFGAFQHVFLFGQPHPDTPEEDRTGITAADVNEMTADLAFPSDNPCGDRTAVCELLSPQDIINYDSNNEALGLDPGEGQLARICSYNPQFGINGGSGLPTECGPQGTPLTGFRGDLQSGGMNLDDVTGAPTWLNTMPGWYDDIIIILGLGEAGDLLWFEMEFEDVVTDSCCIPHDNGVINPNGVGVFAEGGQLEYGTYNYIAVNPKIPKPSDPTWCVQPGFLSVGDDDVLSDNGWGQFSDPGIYGPYVADAIDTDVRPGTGQNQYIWAQQEHKDTVRDGPVTSPVPIPEEGPAGVPLDNDPADDKIGLREIENIGHFVTHQDTDALDIPEDVAELIRRADYDESSDPDPDVPTPETPLSDPLRYERTLDSGFRCDFQGTLDIRSGQDTQQGAVQFNLNVIANSDIPNSGNTWIKDPTAVSEFMGVPLPEDEADTKRSGWQVDHYDFNGITRAQVDSNKNGEFDGCAEPLGQPQPGSDFCGWEGIWDAYNGECENAVDESCDEILTSRNYNITEGVGLYAVIKTDGPTIVEDESAGAGTDGQYTVLGDDDTTATHCVIGISIDFKDKLMNQHNLDVATDQELIDELCWNDIPGDRQGQALIFEDAFTDQNPNTGSYGSNIQFHKLAPTADGTDNLLPWEGFEICVTGVWNVDAGETASDTLDNIQMTGHQEFSDCDAFYNA